MHVLIGTLDHGIALTMLICKFKNEFALQHPRDITISDEILGVNYYCLFYQLFDFYVAPEHYETV